jgi:hypothetical protein
MFFRGIAERLLLGNHLADVPGKLLQRVSIKQYTLAKCERVVATL